MHDSNASDRARTETEPDAAALWMQQLATLPPPATALLNADVLWWQAQALRRLDEQRRLTAKLEIGERIQAVCLSVGVLALLGWLFGRVPGFWQLPALAVTATMCAALVAIAAVMALWGERSV